MPPAPGKEGRNEKDGSNTLHAGCDSDGIERGVISGRGPDSACDPYGRCGAGIPGRDER